MHSLHFSEAELACHGMRSRPPCGCGGVNACQQVLVDALEALRVAVGVPVTIDDAYRCAVHNAAVGGVPHSQHVEGLAADIVIQGMTPAEMYNAARKITAFALGGIGVTLGPTGYIHVDTRGAWGTPEARWCYVADGKPHAGSQCAWDPALDA